MRDLGVRLRLFIGEKELRPAPFAVAGVLTSLEVRNNDRRRDGFQMTFQLGRPDKKWDYPLLEDGLLDPPNHVSIVVIIQGVPEVLINGIITQHQILPSNEPGQSQLQVTGEDTGLLLDLADHRTVHRDQSDSDIVRKIVAGYDGFQPQVKRTTDKHAAVPQRETDRALIERLAGRNSYVFFTEPTGDPGESLVYWGPKDRKGVPVQSALNMNMDWLTTVTQLSFNYDALRAAKPKVTIIDPRTKQSVPLPEPSPQPAPLAARQTKPLRERALPNTSGLTHQEATRRAQVAADEGSEAVSANGELDVVHYGRVLRSRRRVDVRGAGRLYDGTYYVKQVTHRIKRGEYRQSFGLTREEREASQPKVTL